jgi:hypothetical protein
MVMRREGELQGDLLMTWAEMPRSPGRYFRMHMIGYFEGLASERGIVWLIFYSYGRAARCKPLILFGWRGYFRESVVPRLGCL